MTSKVIREWMKKFEHDWENTPPDYAGDVEKHCQYPIPMPLVPEYSTECGEPAAHWVYDEETDLSLFVCERHAERFDCD